MPVISALRRLSVPKIGHSDDCTLCVKNTNGFGDGVQLLECLPGEYKATLKLQKQIKAGTMTVHSGGRTE